MDPFLTHIGYIGSPPLLPREYQTCAKVLHMSHSTVIFGARVQCHLYWVRLDSEKRQLTWDNEKFGSSSPCEFSQSCITSTMWQVFTKWASSFSHLSGCWRAWIHSVMDLPLREPIKTHTGFHRPPWASLCQIPFPMFTRMAITRFDYSHLMYQRWEELSP